MDKSLDQPHHLRAQMLPHLEAALALADQAGLLLEGARIAHIIDTLHDLQTEAPQSRSDSATSRRWHPRSAWPA